MEIVVQQIINALSLGGVYALLALGLAIVFSIMGLVNFAHGEIMTLGGYAMWFVTVQFGAPLPIVFVAAVGTSMVAALADGAHRVPPGPRRERGDDAPHELRGLDHPPGHSSRT